MDDTASKHSGKQKKLEDDAWDQAMALDTGPKWSGE